MNRPQLYTNFLLAVVLMLGITVISASAQDTRMQDARMQGPEINAREMQSLRAAAMRPTPTTLYTVTQDFDGNFDNVDALMARFTEEAKRQGLPNANPQGVVVLYEDPTGKSQFRMGVGVTLSKRVEVKEPLKLSVMSFTAVRATHVGPYQQLGRVYNTIESTVRERRPQVKGVAAMQRETSWPVVLRLVNDPKKVTAAEAFRTEIIVPIKQ